MRLTRSLRRSWWVPVLSQWHTTTGRGGVRRELWTERRERDLRRDEHDPGDDSGGCLSHRTGVRQREGRAVRRELGFRQRECHLPCDERRRRQYPGGFCSPRTRLRHL